MAQNLRNTILHLAIQPLIFAASCPKCISVLGLNPWCQVSLVLVLANTRVKCVVIVCKHWTSWTARGAQSVDKYHYSWMDANTFLLSNDKGCRTSYFCDKVD